MVQIMDKESENTNENLVEGKVSAASGVKEEGRLSYDQVIDIANQLHQENNKLKHELHKVANDIAYIRMDYLFKIATNKESFGKEIVEKALKEIEEMLFSEELEE